MERRAAAEWRAAGRRLVGLAGPFERAKEVKGFNEVIRRGAFKRGLASGTDVVGLVDHDPTRLLARTRTRTLRLEETPRGLAFELDLPETRDAEDLLALAQRGDLGGMSIGFLIPRVGERRQARSRELVEVDLREVSVVHSWPAYDGTSVAARMREEETRRAVLRRRYLETL